MSFDVFISKWNTRKHSNMLQSFDLYMVQGTRGQTRHICIVQGHKISHDEKMWEGRCNWVSWQQCGDDNMNKQYTCKGWVRNRAETSANGLIMSSKIHFNINKLNYLKFN